MDPQQRLLLEWVWEAIERSGVDPKSLRGGQVGVFIGTFTQDYGLLQAGRHEEKERDAYFGSGNSTAMLAGRVAYSFGFQGPAFVLNTACSSSLVAIHQACEALKRGGCDLAVAGGVNLILSPDFSLSFCRSGMLAPDGRCKAFDASANGYVRGEGGGVVLLKRLSEAQKTGDTVLAVIKGTAVNQDGAGNGLTAPNGRAQEKLLRHALEEAGLEPEQISCLEAHGTGTALGDPVEVKAIEAVYGVNRSPENPLYLGSVKANVGHLEAASGMVGLIKMILALRRKTIPPHLHYKQSGPELDLGRVPAVIPTKPTEWRVAKGEKRRAGISAFGFSGTNAHLLIEEHIRKGEGRGVKGETKAPYLIVLSAKNEDRLKEAVRNLCAFTLHASSFNISDLAYTLQVGRAAMNERLAFIVQDKNDLSKMLKEFIQDDEQNELFYRGRVRPNRTNSGFTLHGEAGTAFLSVAQSRREWGNLGQLWAHGSTMDWEMLYSGEKPRRMVLPTYPFARERYWFSESGWPRKIQKRLAREGRNAFICREVWKAMPSLEVAVERSAATIIYFQRSREDGLALEAGVKGQNRETVFIRAAKGEVFEKTSETSFTLRSNRQSDYKALFEALNEWSARTIVVYRWAEGEEIKGIEYLYSLLNGLKAGRKKIDHLLVTGVVRRRDEDAYALSWIGYERSMSLVLPDLELKILYGTERAITDQEIEVEMGEEGGVIRYEEGKRYRLHIEKETPPERRASVLSTGGVYLITGGCGGLGRVFSAYLAETYKASLLLTGRREQNAEIEKRLGDLKELGAEEALYCAVDVADGEQMAKVIGEAGKRWGRIDGIIHAAGLGSQKTLFEKSWKEFRAVLAPKLEGAGVLDALTGREDLDFICYFSSSSAALGDFGQCDYAVANRFLTGESSQAKRSRRIVIHWPLWREGGIKIGEQKEIEMYLKNSGQRYLENEEGLEIWERILGAQGRQHFVFAGEPSRIDKILKRVYRFEQSSPASVESIVGPSIRRDLKKEMAAILKIKAEGINEDADFVDIGFDSITLREFSRALNEHYDLVLVPSIFFSYSAVRTLSVYLLEKFYDAMVDFYNCSAAGTEIERPVRVYNRGLEPVREEELIAVVGLSGRFPGAKNIEALWDVLSAGKETLTEVPPERWDWRSYFRKPGDERNRIAGNRGGFIAGAEEFDPDFFDLSPRDAMLMDPRQRLLLQESWRALEDAGYVGKSVRGKPHGVFVGVEEGEYRHLLEDDEGFITGTHNGILAGRISYFLDWRGPNLALNTACSSALVALHQACESLKRGESELALVAGVNLLLSPMIYKELTRMGVLSENGICHAFDRRANGIVPAEAVAVMVLKKLSQAREDQDHIHGVIRGTAVNYDGKTNGITAPNGLSQEALIRGLYEKYRINVEEIDYIAAHGTGTSLGDPVEVNALKEVFKTFTRKKQYCGIGSIKTHLGHTLAASGMVSLISVLLGMKHRIMPGTLNSEMENESIDLKESPFYINHRAKPWEKEKNKKRLAAVSAFGMSGTNAHVVVEEHPEPDKKKLCTTSTSHIIVLSAKKEEGLREMAENLCRFILSSSSFTLADMAYTLQMGREAMEHRAAFEVREAQELAKRLESFTRGIESAEKTPLTEPAASWVKGRETDWSLLYEDGKGARISLPTYPFSRKRYGPRPRPDDPEKPKSPAGKKKIILSDHGGEKPLSVSTENGKNPWIVEKQPASAKSGHTEAKGLKEALKKELAKILYLEKSSEVSEDKKFLDMGLDSITGVEWIKRINRLYKLNITTTKLYDYPTLSRFVEYMLEISQPLPADETGHDTTSHERRAKSFGLLISTVQEVDETGWGPWERKPPGEGEVEMEVKASGVNFPDTMCIKGLYPTMPDYPFVPGFEAAGVLVRTGKNVGVFQVGDEVMALTGKEMGGHASYVNVPVSNVVRKPAFLTFEEACSLPVAFLTAWHALELAGLKKGEHLLIQTASGGVGLMAVQLANLRGAVLYGTSGKPHKLSFLKQIGVDHVMNYNIEELDRHLRDLSRGRGMDVALNMLSGEAIQKGIDSLAPGGRYLELAVHGLKTGDKLDLSGLINNQVFYSIDCRRLAFARSALIRSYLERMVEMLEAKIIYPTVHRIYPSTRITEALDYIRRGDHVGKIVISYTERDMVDQTEECLEKVRKQKAAAGNNGSEEPSLTVKRRRKTEDPVAVIGLSARFPGAKNAAEFWRNLEQGVDSVTEIPPDRWEVRAYYDQEETAVGKSYSKWGGFLEDVDQFDPLFFAVSPKEAEGMDPQQRLFLEEAWKALEDAGYGPKTLSGMACGVFVGVRNGDYEHKLLEHGRTHDAYMLMGNVSSILAARIAYLLNLTGPNMAIDTACSSSLVAVHQACQSIKVGESVMALAGGVCVMTGPGMHIMTAKAGMLSREGRCKTFDQDADGFVPAEGVGVVVLKSLKKALEDADPIYGVIVGSGVNQDGSTNGITAPSGESQKKLALKIHEESGLDPSSIRYVECHGTGTKLGDPIEIEALSELFKSCGAKKGSCAVGSVKTNIGHSLAAAGVASLIKVLLAMKHKKLPPSLHFKRANEHIRFEETPFYVNDELRDWKGGPRRAAVSSFGFSGTNAHLLVEERLDEKPETRNSKSEKDKDCLMVLSAKSKEALNEMASNLKAFILQFSSLNLSSLAYTLQVGRMAMEERLALVIKNRRELEVQLTKFMEGEDDESLLFRGEAGDEQPSSFLEGEAGRSFVGAAWKQGELSTIGRLWARGMDIDWPALYQGRSPQRIHLPTYPFARERCWVEEKDVEDSRLRFESGGGGLKNRRHPLIHENGSTLKEKRFFSTFTGDEFYLKDHVVAQDHVLVGAALIEMARAAGERAAGPDQKVVRLKHTVWMHPVRVHGDACKVCVSLYPAENDSAEFEIKSVGDDGETEKMHCRGVLEFADKGLEAQGEIPSLSVETLLAHLPHEIRGEDLYNRFDELGLHLGDSFQGIKILYSNEQEALAKIELPHDDRDEDFLLHPTLLDSVFQAVAGLNFSEFTQHHYLRIPYEVDEITWTEKLPARCYAHVAYLHGERNVDPRLQRYEMKALTEQGQVVLKVKGYYPMAFDPLHLDRSVFREKGKNGMICFRPVWRPMDAVEIDAENRAEEGMVLAGEQEDYQGVFEALKQKGRMPSSIMVDWGNEIDPAKEAFHLNQALLKVGVEKPLVVVYPHVMGGALEPLYRGLEGLVKTVGRENENIKGVIAGTVSGAPGEKMKVARREWAGGGNAFLCRYKNGVREVCVYDEMPVGEESETLFRQRGVYLIAGGRGGIGSNHCPLSCP